MPVDFATTHTFDYSSRKTLPVLPLLQDPGHVSWKGPIFVTVHPETLLVTCHGSGSLSCPSLRYTVKLLQPRSTLSIFVTLFQQTHLGQLKNPMR